MRDLIAVRGRGSRAAASLTLAMVVGAGALGAGGAQASAAPPPADTAVTAATPVVAFPQVQRFNRGVDVQAVQYLLQAAGHPGVTADGVFGPGTQTAVEDFQTAHGLEPDGKVGPLTWGELTSDVASGSNASAVRAVQVLLNKKRGAGLQVDGMFGPGTRAAVTAFQSHARLAPTGVVDAATWKALAWHYAKPSTTNICDQDPDGNTDANWGTGSSIGQFEAAARQFATTGQGKVPFGDISHEHGGDIAGHVSHELGVDIDVWPIRTDGAQCSAGRITWESPTYDRAATRRLVQAIRETAPGDRVALIFFNDPVLISEGLTTRYDNHDNHLHVRYR